MATSLRELIVSVSADTTKYQREMDRASRMGGQYFKSIQQGGSEATRSWDRQTSAARTHATAIQASSQAVMRYASVAAAALGLGQLTQLADGWTNLNNRLRLVTDGTAEFASAQANVLRIAQETRQPLDATAELYQRIAQNQEALGLSGQGVADIVQTISQAMVVSGTSAQGAQAALVQLGQAFASGVLRGEELNSVLEQAPALAMAIANGLGVPIGKLREMGKAGELTADQVIVALQRQASAVDASFGTMDATISQSMTNLRTAFQIFIGQSDDVAGASSTIAAGIGAVARNMEAIATVGGAAALGAIAGKMVQIGQAAAASAVGMVQSRAAAIAEAVAIRDATLAGQLKAQADLRRAQAGMTAARGTAESARQSRTLANALLIERQATLAAAQAQTAYARATNIAAAAGRGLMGVLGGPVGLALTVGTVAAGWLLFRDNSSEATKALRDMAGPLDEVLAKFTELGAAQQMQAMRDAQAEIREASDAMAEAVATMSQNVGGTGVATVFREIDEQVRAGTLSVEEGSRRISDALETYLNQRGRGEGMRNLLIDLAANWEQNAQTSQRASERVEGFNRVNAGTAPGAAAAAGGLRDQAGGYRELGEEAQKALQKMQDQAQSVRGQIERLGKSARDVAVLDVRDEFRRLQRSGEIDFSNREDPNVQRVIAAGSALINNRDELASAQRRLAESTRAAAGAQRSANKEVSDAEKAAARLIEQYDDLAASQAREIALHGEIGRAAAMAYDTATGALRGFTEAQKASLNEGAAWLDWLDEMAAFDEATDGIAEGYKNTAETMSTYADQAARNMQSHFADYLFDPFADGTRGMVEGFSEAIRRMLAEAAAAKIFELVGGAMANYGGQGAWGNIIRGVGGAMQTDGARAGGGQVKPFGAYDVTEHGPELLTYGGRQVLMMGATGGVVSPLMNKAGGGASGGGPLQVVINNNGSDRVQAREERQQQPDGSVMRRLIIDVVSESMFGGQLGAAGRNYYGWRPKN